jgi:hypothetical protein
VRELGGCWCHIVLLTIEGAQGCQTVTRRRWHRSPRDMGGSIMTENLGAAVVVGLSGAMRRHRLSKVGEGGGGDPA